MADAVRKVGTGARYVLAAVRLFNGGAALVAPRWLGTRAGVDMDGGRGSVYFIRLFGVRTVYVAAELVLARDDHLRNALRVAPAIHASDALSAAAAGVAGALPPKAARTTTAISAGNLVLAILAARTARPARRGVRRFR